MKKLLALLLVGAALGAGFAYVHALLNEGVYIAPSQFEACFTSTAHDRESLDLTIDAFAHAFDAASRTSGDA